MKQKKVFLLSGPPGCGKSTWVRNHMLPSDEWISRDNVRFSIVREDEEYFSHEDDVFDTFINYINQTLEDPKVENVYIDATHINPRSRRKPLSSARLKNISELNCVYFKIPFETCLKRNAERTGRAFVPESAIKNMYDAYIYPTKQEKFTHIYEVDEYGLEMEVETDG